MPHNLKQITLESEGNEQVNEELQSAEKFVYQDNSNGFTYYKGAGGTGRYQDSSSGGAA